MKRVLAGVLMVILVFSFVGCTCSIDKKAVGDLQATDKIILPQYVAYVEADPKLSKEQKEDRKKLVESLQRLVEAMADHVK